VAAVNQTHAFNLLSGASTAEHITDNTDVTAQWLIKPDGISRFTMFCQKRDGIYASAAFDMRGDGSVTGITGCAATIEPDVLGYYRMSMSLNSSAGASTFRFGGQMALDSGSRTFLGDGVSGFRIAYWGIERGLIMTSPSAANGTTPTIRAADDLLTSPTWMGLGAKTIGLEFTPLSNIDQTILEAGTGDSIILRLEGGNVRYAATRAGESVAFLSGPSPVAGITRTVVITAGNDAFLLVQDGQSLGVDTVGRAPADLTSLRIGGGLNGSARGPMALKILKFWNEALAMDEALEASQDLQAEGEDTTPATVTIQPSITVPPDENTVTIVVTLSDQTLNAQVGYRTVSGTALSGIDFLEESGTINFFSGELFGEITIQLGERDDEDRSFRLELITPQNVRIGVGVCEVLLPKKIPALPATSLDVLFGASVGSDWVLTRPTTAPRRNSSGTWELVGINAPAHHWQRPNVEGVLIDAAGYEQHLFDSALPLFFHGSTRTIDLTTPTMVGSRSVVIAETATTGEHGFSHPITAGVAATVDDPEVPATAEIPTGDFTTWLMVESVGRTRWLMEVKGRDNVWHSCRFTLTGAGTAEMVTVGASGFIQQDTFSPSVYRIGIGRTQGPFAGVEPEFRLTAVDGAGATLIAGSTANSLRIIHMQVEARIGWGAPLVVAGATAKTVRAPDDLRPNGNWFKLAGYSIGIQAARLSDLPTIQRIVHIRDAVPYQDDYGIYVNNGIVAAPNTTGGTFNSNIPGAATQIGIPFTVILAVDPFSRFALFQNGVKTGQQLVAGITPPITPSNMKIGARMDGTNLQACSLFLQRIRFWNGPLSDAEGVWFSGNLAAGNPPVEVVPPTVSVPTSLRIAEGGLLTVPIAKSGPGACSITYTTKAGTASYGLDYDGVGPVVMSFADADTTKSFTVQTTADTIADHGEVFTVELSAPVGCNIGNKTCVVTITESPTVSLPLNAPVKEGDLLSLNIVKTGEGACSVAWETKQATASVGGDYTGVGSPPVVVNFGANETSKTITVQTKQDTEADPNETFTIQLSGEVGCAVGNRICTVTITDDEAPPASGIYARSVTFASPRAGGGIGKQVYRVTSLADDGSNGTLRYGINLGSRHIIFERGGVIQMQGDWSFSKTDVYISGETAPYPGITLRGNAYKGGNLRPTSSKRMVFSHINIERCHDQRVVANSNGDAVDISPGSGTAAEDIEFRHCSFFWTNDETTSVYPTGSYPNRGHCRRISYTDCLFSEPLFQPEESTTGTYRAHYEGGAIESKHNYGILIGVNSLDVDIQNCVSTDTSWRNPFIDSNTRVVVANHIALNGSKGAHISINNYDPVLFPYKVTCVGYLMISGPNTSVDDSGFKFHTSPTAHPEGSLVWVDGLYSIQGPGSKYKPRTVVHGYSEAQKVCVADITKVPRPVDIPGSPVVKMSQADILQRAENNVGPFPKNRIPNIARKIKHLKDKTGKYVNHESEVGGPSSFSTVTRALDGTTKFPDGVTIPAYPTPPASPTATDIKKIKDWLELFLSRIQYD
jgi:hypothetical protein